MVAFGKASGGGRRAATRSAAPLVVVLSTLSRTYQAVLVDISATGARVSGRELPAAEDVLDVAIGKVKTFGVVRWRTDTDCGLHFDEPLATEEIVSIRHQAGKGRGLPPAIGAALDDWMLGLAR